MTACDSVGTMKLRMMKLGMMKLGMMKLEMMKLGMVKLKRVTKKGWRNGQQGGKRRGSKSFAFDCPPVLRRRLHRRY